MRLRLYQQPRRRMTEVRKASFTSSTGSDLAASAREHVAARRRDNGVPAPYQPDEPKPVADYSRPPLSHRHSPGAWTFTLPCQRGEFGVTVQESQAHKPPWSGFQNDYTPRHTP
ncbi:hypothetical protein AAFF_G00369420 [Aldrovandia affinis]|uniref:Uncharacterized protein n=1 Tax=Aldrovandia affinis TaxID=143900 RepID=A0AAD7SHH2_9TELE|nr:hypothetical protein AAFF_G00369420 [Aldrovandia affinis]